MSRNALLVLNLYDFAVPNVRACHEHAAKHWDCELIYVTKPTLPRTFHATFEKLRLWHLVKDYDRVIVSDADILFRSNSESPFHHIRPEAIGGVLDLSLARYPEGHPHRPLLRDFVQMRYYDPLCQLFGVKGFNAEQYQSRYINSGFWHFAPKVHEGILRQMDALVPVIIRDEWKHMRTVGHFEQSIINYLVSISTYDVHLLTPWWNWIGPDPSWTGVQPGIIGYHFTGWDFTRGDRLNTFQWRE